MVHNPTFTINPAKQNGARETLSVIGEYFTQRFGKLAHPSVMLRNLRDYFGFGKRRAEPVGSRAELRRFLETRASYVAQFSLYGYLRTRAGQRYPELFDDDVFVKSINIAKWHIWLACLSDLAVYSGGMLARRMPGSADAAGALVRELVAEIIAAAGQPEDADDEFAAHAARIQARLALCEWNRIADGEDCFSESPAALVRWAPIVDELKTLDEPIVLNSVRFRWQEVRRHLRQFLDAEGVLGESAGHRP
ncbi:MAG: hypothetical protein KF853_15895 [Rhodocyclaceae bacterium]|nr:hypothetical protein [Rhodocyclaceae bacterium]MCW5596774.1 hypothetical protein [Rhodocyclaceae bacterium]